MGLICILIPLALFPQAEKQEDTEIGEMIERLGADFIEDREPAREALRKVGAAAEKKLVQALSHPDHRVRGASLELLTPLKSRAAMKRASELFATDEDPKIHEASFRLLQAIGKEAEESLVGALVDLNAALRRGAIESLTQLKSLKSVDKISDLSAHDTDTEVRAAALRYLLSVGPAGQPHLIRHLEDPDASIRRRALESLDEAPSDEAVAAVSRLFGQESVETALLQAARFLEHAGLRGEPAFLAGLANPRPPQRLASIQGLTAIKSPKGLLPVADVFLGPCPPDVRQAAALYLKSQGVRAEGALLRGIESLDSEVRLGSIKTLGEIGSERALEPVRRLFHGEKSGPIREICFEFFRLQGLRAEDDLLSMMGDDDKAMRCRAALALGAAGSMRAIPRLISVMTELDPMMKEASEAALASIGPKALEEVRAAVRAGRLRAPAVETIERLHWRYEVERLLETQFGDDLVSGFCDDQFSNLAAFGRDKAVPMLAKIASEPSYAFRREQPVARQQLYRIRMQELAVMALGELGGEEAISAVRAVRNNPASARNSRRFQEETLVSLHRLGDKAPLEAHLQQARLLTDRLLEDDDPRTKVQGCYELFSLGMLYSRLKRYNEGTQAYLDVLRAVERYKLDKSRFQDVRWTLYNLACLSALRGDRPKSIEWLEKALREGPIDRSWILKDRDLDSLRNEEGYKRILADDRLFERRIGENPPGGR